MSEINLTSLSIYNMSGPPGLLLFFSSTYTLLGHLVYRDKKLTLHAAAEYVLPANRDLSWLSGSVSFAWNSFGPAGKANITATIGAVFPL